MDCRLLQNIEPTTVAKRDFARLKLAGLPWCIAEDRLRHNSSQRRLQFGRARKVSVEPPSSVATVRSHGTS